MLTRYRYLLFLLGLSFTAVFAQFVPNSPAQAQTVNFNCANVTEIPQLECAALARLYESTNGDNWSDNTGWLATNTPCSWYGVGCQLGHVTSILLSNNRLNGSLPIEIAQLQKLMRLDLGANQLTAVPDTLGQLGNLQNLRLNNNQLCGDLPASLTNLTLQNLDVSYNHLTATTPDLLAWLNTHQPNWADTQTPCPTSPTDTHLIGYIAFDNNLASYTEETMSRFQAGTAVNPHVRVTLLLDSLGDDNSQVIFIANGVITETHKIPWLPGIKEVDMSDEATLSGFLTWARSQQTAGREIVAILGHGSGLSPEIQATDAGIGTMAVLPPLPRGHDFTPTDITSGSYMSTTELGRALAEATDNGNNPFDLIFFDGCFYGNFDILYEIRDTAEIFVASPNYLWGGFLYNQYIPAMTPEASNEQIAQAILDLYTDRLDETHPHSLLWVRGAEIEPIAHALNGLGDALQAVIAADPANRQWILDASLASKFVDTTLCAGDLELCAPDQLIDAASFAVALQTHAAPSSVVEAAAGNLLTALTAVTVHGRDGSPWIKPDVFWSVADVGLTIMAPLTPTLATTPQTIWLASIYTETAGLEAVWSPDPTQTVTIVQPWASAVDGRWDNFLAAWYGAMTPTVGQMCHQLLPVLEPDTEIAWPEVTAVSPDFGLDNVPTQLFIHGLNFSEPTAVALNGIPLDLLHVQSNLIIAEIPAGLTPGWYDVAVQTAVGIAGKAQLFEVLAATAIDDLRATPDLLWSAPLILRAGSEGGLGVTVQRLGGEVTLSEVVAELSINGAPIGRGVTQLFAPNAIEPTTPVFWTPPGSGTYTLCATLDPDNLIPETDESNNVVCREITVLPSVNCTQPPLVNTFTIAQNALFTLSRNVVLDVNATYFCGGDSGWMQFVEFDYILGAKRWVPIAKSAWLPYATTHNNVPWELLPIVGVRYMSAWTADTLGNISLAPSQSYINLLPQTQHGTLAPDGVALYRIYLQPEQNFSAQLTAITGDADLYVYGPDGVLVDSSANVGSDAVFFTAALRGTYQIEVVGYTTATYQLSFAGAGTHQSNGEQAVNSKPIRSVAAVPVDSWPEYYQLEPAPLPLSQDWTLYLPTINKFAP